jgi:hypothetical protein
MATPRMLPTESQLKAALTAAKEKRREATFPRADAALRSQQLAHQRAVEQVLRPVLTKAGLDVEKLKNMAEENQSEVRRILQNNKAEAAQRSSLEMAAIRERFQQRARTLQNRANPFVVPTILQPIFIWVTDLSSFQGQQIAPNDSWVKFLVGGGFASSGTVTATNSFVFLWENQLDDVAVINVASSLVLNGFVYAEAAGASFGAGDQVGLSLTANLLLLPLWQADPQNPEWPPPTQQSVGPQTVFDYTLEGHSFYQGSRSYQQTFSALPFDLSYDDFFLVAPQSSVAFEVSLTAYFDWSIGGGNITDFAEFDFANDKFGYEVMCPGLQVDLLTAPQTATVHKT